MELVHGTYTRTDGAPASGVYPRFFMEEVQDPVASAAEGRPIFGLHERVEIIMPGNQLMIPVKRVTDMERQRWPAEYKAFRDGVEMVPDGTPLEQWPILNRAQVAELKAVGFRSVENIAGASDTVLQQSVPMGGFGLRERAKAYLDDAAACALTEKVTAENTQLRAEISNLQRQVTELGELLRQTHAEMTSIRNAPHSFETMVLPPLAQAGAPQSAGASSLSAFDAPRRGPGRPRKQEEAA